MTAAFTHPYYERWLAQGGIELESLPLSCDVCGDRSFTTLCEMVDGGHEAPPAHLPVVACDRCGCIMQSIRLPPEFYEWYYAEEYRKALFGEARVPQAFIDDQRNRGLTLLRSLESVLPSPGDLLDVGCSAGGTILPFRDRGWRVYGVDPDATYVAYGRDVLGLPIDTASAEEMKLDAQSFDLIIILGSLEHVLDAATVLRLVRVAARDDALLVVEGFGLGQSRLRGRFGLNHRRYFTANSIDLLLEANGWTPFRTTGEPLSGPTRPGSVFCLARRGEPLSHAELVARIDGGKRDLLADLSRLLVDMGIG